MFIKNNINNTVITASNQSTQTFATLHFVLCIGALPSQPSTKSVHDNVVALHIHKMDLIELS